MLIECVPNFSEGRDLAVIGQIGNAIAAHSRVLHVTSDRDHNRSVITFAGSPENVESAVIAAAGVAIQAIDLRVHRGIHPRIGAMDVIPFVPVAAASMEDCAAIAKRVAQQLWQRFCLPSFFYEAAAAGRGLEDVRRAASTGAPPDTGSGRHPTAGASAIGARKFLVAWNILLKSTDLPLARKIARTIRHSSGGFPGVKALGLHLDERGCVQVSINSTDFATTPLPVIFEAVARLCRESGVSIEGAELIGLIPEAAFSGSNLPWLNFEPDMILEEALRIE